MIDDPKAGIETYKKYLAVRNHFKTGYDFTKYGGTVNVNPSTYLKRNDKVFFQRIEKKYPGEATEYFVAQFAAGEEYVASMTGAKGEQNYKDWLDHLDNIYELTRADVQMLVDECDGDIQSALISGHHPLVFRMYLAGDLFAQTLVVLNNLTGFLGAMGSDPVTDLHKNYLKKLSVFVRYNKNRMAKLLKEELE